MRVAALESSMPSTENPGFGVDRARELGQEVVADEVFEGPVVLTDPARDVERPRCSRPAACIGA